MTDLISTLGNPGEFDALTMVREGEPYFMLLGRDRLAPPLVQQWADANRLRALEEFAAGTIDEERRDRELRKSTQAEAQGWAMASFKAGDMAKKVAGEPTVKTYSGFELDEETKRRDRVQSARARARAAVNNAVGEVMELMEALEAMGAPDTREVAMLQSRVSDMERLGNRLAQDRKAIVGKK